MKKLLLSVFLFLLVSPAYALIEIENVDKDKFKYQTGYQFATSDLAASQTEVEIPTATEDAGHNFDYVISRGSSTDGLGSIVGISVAGNLACTVGAATFDVTINGNITGVQTVIEPTVSTVRSAVGASGAADPQYAYMRQERLETTVPQGFKESAVGVANHDSDHPYGKATGLTAGNRIGVKVTTSSGFVPAGMTDYVIVIYVLE